jgi:uncharacterized protein
MRRLDFSRVAIVGLAALVVTIATAGPISGLQDLPTVADAAVNDFANVVDSATEAEIDRRVRSLVRASGDFVYVVTVDTIAPYGSIEEYAVRLFEKSKFGSRQKDNGVLIVAAVKDRKVRIETGYALEQFVTDGFAGETIRQAMLPAFREGRYGEGLLNGATRVIQRIAQGRGVSLTDLPPDSDSNPPQDQLPPWVIPVGIIIVFLVLRAMSRAQRGSSFTRRRRGGTWSGWHGGVGGFGGGGFGGGFGGGGGGGGGGLGGLGGGRSGGGGASGSW